MTAKYSPYHINYSSKLLRGIDVDARPALVQKIAQQLGSSKKSLLDIGCGMAHKLSQMAKNFLFAIGVEPSPAMLEQAKKNVHTTSHIQLIRGISQTLPIQDEMFDVVTAILSWWDPQEIYRVLKPKGNFLIECLGPEDKSEFTKYFGKDANGFRGANLNTSFSQMKIEIEKKLACFFKNITIQNVSWLTSYNTEGLWVLLNNTYLTVRNFNPIEDKDNFDRAIMALTHNDKIILKQNRLIISAIKK